MYTSCLPAVFSFKTHLQAFIFSRICCIGDGNMSSFWHVILIALLISLALVFIVTLPLFLRWLKLKSMPEQKIQVKVLAKGKYVEKLNGFPPGRTFLTRYAAFEFPDGSRKCFRILSPKILSAIQINGTGLLVYKERKGRKLFISFSKD